MLSREFTDPRLVAAYDTLNAYPPGTQPDFYLRLAREIGARSVVDVGCGTGLLSRLFLEQGHDVTGLDPAGPMLEIARARPGADRARWIEGGVGALDVRGADLAVMSGHVAQFFITDEEWDEALRVLHAALRPGGHLAFESRNPAAQAWETFAEASRTTVVDERLGRIERWTEVREVRGDVLVSCLHFRFVDRDEEIVTDMGDFRFRSADDLRRSLAAAGFTVTEAYGDWDRSPFTERSPEVILVAVADERPVGGGG